MGPVRDLRTDVLVIGAGPAGCAAGIELARAGIDALVVDRARFPRPKTCGDALSNRAVRIVEELGAGEALAAAPHTAVRGSAAVFPDGTRVVRDYGARPGMIVGRLALDELLRRAVERVGATVMEGVNVRKLLVADGRVHGAEADAVRIEARAVLAADGHGSVAWTSLGGSAPRGRSLAVSATAYYEGMAPLAEPGVSEHHFAAELPCGYGWIFPPVQGVANVGVYLRSDAYRAAGVSLGELFERFVARHRRQFDGAERVSSVRVWSLPLAGFAKRVEAPGLLACGDAGRFIDPLAGEGIWQALHTGRLAGRTVAEALARGELDARAARRFRRATALTIDAPSELRARIQDGMRLIVERGLWRSPSVHAALGWGFGRGSLELTKDVS